MKTTATMAKNKPTERQARRHDGIEQWRRGRATGIAEGLKMAIAAFDRPADGVADGDSAAAIIADLKSAIVARGDRHFGRKDWPA